MPCLTVGMTEGSDMAKKKEAEVLEGEAGPTEAGWHAIESFLRCPKAWQYENIRGIRIPEQFEQPAFTVGRMMHAGKAKWIANKFKTDEKTVQKVHAAVEGEMELGSLPSKPEALAYGRKYMTEYMAHWGIRPLPKPVATEYKLGPAAFAPDSPFFLYRTARLDDVSHYPEAGGALCIGETKTTSDSIKSCVDQYTLHGQPLLQKLLWKYAPQGEAMHGPVAGVMLDVIKKGYGTDRSQFARVFLPITDRAVEWYQRSFAAQLRAASMVDWNADAPRNINGCTYMAGRARVACKYRDLCLHGRTASVKYTFADGTSLMQWKKPGREVPPWD